MGLSARAFRGIRQEVLAQVDGESPVAKASGGEAGSSRENSGTLTTYARYREAEAEARHFPDDANAQRRWADALEMRYRQLIGQCNKWGRWAFNYRKNLAHALGSRASDSRFEEYLAKFPMETFRGIDH